jgi:hypothetical protein
LRRGRLAALLVGVAVVAVVLVAVGRWERGHHADIQNARIARVRAAVGQLGGSDLDAYRMRPQFDCLLYRRGKNPYALELCVDRAGRIVEAIDRRRGTPWIGSLREEPRLATGRVPRDEVDRLLRRMGARPAGSAS